ncbi:MAG: DUF493 domain-containing protein [Bdellovibrionales bacterium]|nr:DUF493 domain-containing protein [Bdellovibrionales bacterium]
MYNKKTEKFKELLDQEHNFPTQYTFKFIVPHTQQKAVERLFPNETIDLKASRKGNYISLSVTMTIESSDLVIAIYEKASEIKGLISL